MRVDVRSVGVFFCRRSQYFSFSECEGGYEVDADGVVEGGGEVVFDVAHEHAGLAYS